MASVNNQEPKEPKVFSRERVSCKRCTMPAPPNWDDRPAICEDCKIVMRFADWAERYDIDIVEMDDDLHMALMHNAKRRKAIGGNIDRKRKRAAERVAQASLVA